MINRELIRIKIVQLTYAYYQNGNKNMDVAEKELFFSLSKAYDLYNYLLGLVVAITKEERLRVEVATQRAQREETEIPSQKFAYNRFAVQLEENKMLNEFVETQKQTWTDDIETVRKLCNQIEQSETYQAYMASEEDAYEADREVWRKLYKQLIQDNKDLDALLEEKSLYWNDDKEVVDTFVLKTIKRFNPEEKSEQKLLPEYKDEEDKEFARRLDSERGAVPEVYERRQSELGFLTFGLHGCRHHADRFGRNADVSQHSGDGDDQRIRRFGQALQHLAQRQLHQRHAGLDSPLPDSGGNTDEDHASTRGTAAQQRATRPEKP